MTQSYCKISFCEREEKKGCLVVNQHPEIISKVNGEDMYGSLPCGFGTPTKKELYRYLLNKYFTVDNYNAYIKSVLPDTADIIVDRTLSNTLAFVLIARSTNHLSSKKRVNIAPKLERKGNLIIKIKYRHSRFPYPLPICYTESNDIGINDGDDFMVVPMFKLTNSSNKENIYNTIIEALGEIGIDPLEPKAVPPPPVQPSAPPESSESSGTFRDISDDYTVVNINYDGQEDFTCPIEKRKPQVNDQILYMKCGHKYIKTESVLKHIKEHGCAYHCGSTTVPI